MHLKTRLTATIVPPAEDITDSAEITAVKSSCTNQFHMIIFTFAPCILETIYYIPTNALLYCNNLKFLL